MSKAQWYSVRSVFRFDKGEEGKPGTMFEERVVILRASSDEEALQKGRDNAHRYAASDPNPKMLDHVVAFALWEAALKEGEEVWSCLRELKMSDAEFLDHVYAGERLGLRHIE